MMRGQASASGRKYLDTEVVRPTAGIERKRPADVEGDVVTVPRGHCLGDVSSVLAREHKSLERAARNGVPFPDVAVDLRYAGSWLDLEGHGGRDADLDERRKQLPVVTAGIATTAGLAVAALEPR